MFAHRHRSPARRRATAAVEMALLLPFLMFVFVVGVDFARVFYHCLTLTNCARNGALYGSVDATHAADTDAIKAAALVDASNLSPSPNVDSAVGTDADGNPCIQVTVSWTFNMLTSYVGIPSSINLSRTVQMRVAAVLPKNS
jgi:Flp pilus assembly protein TadG